MKSMLLLFFMGLSPLFLVATDSKKKVIYTVAGLGDLPIRAVNYAKNVIGKDIEVVPVDQPRFFSDLGQLRCMQPLIDAVEKNGTEGVIFAFSQGAAAALNYVATVDKGRRVKALILEATVASGNSAMVHAMGKKVSSISSLVPYLAKIRFPFYRPDGHQAIKSINDIPLDMPVILVHFCGDPRVPYEGTCALYYALRQRGNNNVYLISNIGEKHVGGMKSLACKDVIAAVLSKHAINVGSTQDNNANVRCDLTAFQPNHSTFKGLYEHFVAQEEKHAVFAPCARFVESIGIGAAVIIACKKLVDRWH